MNSNPFISKETHFFDLDGTLVYQPEGPEGFDLAAKALPGVIDSIDKLVSVGSCIVITTARDEFFREDTEKQLAREKIQYHFLILGIGSGKRFLYNNTKTHTRDTVEAVLVEKNKGF